MGDYSHPDYAPISDAELVADSKTIYNRVLEIKRKEPNEVLTKEDLAELRIYKGFLVSKIAGLNETLNADKGPEISAETSGLGTTLENFELELKQVNQWLL